MPSPTIHPHPLGRRSVFTPGGCWPTHPQELLLKAALLPREAALAAWEEWLTVADLERLDWASDRLLPLLYRQLETHGVSHPAMARLRGIHRHAWCKTQVQLHHAAPLLRALHAAGVRTLLLKGGALLAHYRLDFGVRPMADFDVLVPPGDALAAAQLLERSGWWLKSGEPFTAARCANRHADEFFKGARHCIDLHWQALPECVEPAADDDFWAAAWPVEFAGESTLVPCPADQLLHTCAHGAAWSQVPPLRWVADAMTVLRAAPELDWDRLLAQTTRRGLSLPLRATLGYLREVFGAPVPASFLQQLANLPVTAEQRLRHLERMHPHHLRSRRVTLAMHLLAYRLAVTRDEARRGAFGFLRHLQEVWKLDSLTRVPLHALLRGWRGRQEE